MTFESQTNPENSAEALKSIGDQFFKTHDLAQAEQYFKRSLDLEPTQFEVYKNLGVICYRQAKLEEAIACYDNAIALKNDYPEAYNNKGLALNDLGRCEEALDYLNEAILLKPDFAFAYNNRGITLKQLNRLDESLESYNRAISLNPDFALAHNNKGNTLKGLEKPKEALLSYNRAIRLKPDYAEAYFNRAEIHYSLKRLDNALSSYNRAIALNPQFADAYSNRALVLKEFSKYEEGHASVDYALMLKPDSAMAYNNKGLLLGAENKLEEAISQYQRAIALKVDCYEAYINLGETLSLLNRHDEALANYDRLISLKPSHAQAHTYRGSALKELKRFDETLDSYDVAFKHNPNMETIAGLRFETKIMLGNWANYYQDLAHLELRIKAGKNVVAALVVLWHFGAPELQLKAVKNLVKAQALRKALIPFSHKYPRHNKIRVAYFSADFYNHPVSILTAELYETHDKSKFETIAFSLVGDKDDYMRRRIEKAFDRFIDVSKLSAKEIVLMARELEIDIAIDLGGYTSFAKPAIFGMRAAPVQINYIGYPGTMGAEFMDYIIADKTVIPESHQQHYAEKAVYLPCFQANDTKRAISARQFTREELGLPPTGFVFCSFNNISKITPTTFDSWMRILKQVEGSVLWLVDNNETSINNLKKEATLRGVDSNRIVLAKRMAADENLARYRMAGLFLDTLPFNAGTTASDALWAGLPVLTLIGEAYASRMAASLLNAIDLPELITTTQEEYEALAIALATQPHRLDEIKQKLAKNRLTTRLFNIKEFTRNIELAYTQMYERYHADLPPSHIEINQ